MSDPQPADPIPADGSTVATTTDGAQTAVITVSLGNCSPSNVLVKAGVPTNPAFRSENAAGCARALVVISSLGVQQVIPANGDPVIDAGILSAGTIEYSCPDVILLAIPEAGYAAFWQA